MPLHLVKAFLIGFLFFLSGCNTLSERSPRLPANAPVKRHVVVLVHGIGGDINSFGKLAPALEKILNQWQIDEKFYVVPFAYSTEDDEQSVRHFAKDLDQFLQNQNADRISIIAHSQGGIVSAVWYYFASQNLPMEIQRKGQVSETVQLTRSLAEKVSSVITLGTPFWGSKLAYFMAETANLGRTMKKVKAKLRLGSQQLIDMSFGSNAISGYRDALRDFKSGLTDSPSLRLLNIAGVVPLPYSKPEVQRLVKTDKNFDRYNNLLTRLRDFEFGTGNRYEGDVAVIVPSARLDYISQNSKLGENEPSAKLVNFSKPLTSLLIVEAAHTTDPTMGKHQKDIGAVDDTCLGNIESCQHASLFPIAHQLLGCSVDSLAALERAMESNLELGSIAKNDLSLLREIQPKGVAVCQNDAYLSAVSKHLNFGKSLELLLSMRGFEVDLDIPVRDGFIEKSKLAGQTLSDDLEIGEDVKPSAKYGEKKSWTKRLIQINAPLAGSHACVDPKSCYRLEDGTIIQAMREKEFASAMMTLKKLEGVGEFMRFSFTASIQALSAENEEARLKRVARLLTGREFLKIPIKSGDEKVILKPFSISIMASPTFSTHVRLQD